METLSRYRTWLIGSAAVFLVILVIAGDDSWLWFLPLFSLGLCGPPLFRGLKEGRNRKHWKEQKSEKEFSGYEELNCGALVEMFQDEGRHPSWKPQVKLKGEASGKAVLTAPLSRKKVLAYRIEAQPLTGKAGDGAGLPFLLFEKSGDWDFRDETGTLAVQGPPRLDTENFQSRSVTWDELRDQFPDWHERVDGIGLRMGWSRKDFGGLLLWEILLEDEEEITLYGEIRKTPQGLAVTGGSSDEGENLLAVGSEGRFSLKVRPAGSPFRADLLFAGTLLLTVVLIFLFPLNPSQITFGPLNLTRTAPVTVTNFHGQNLVVETTPVVAEEAGVLFWNFEPDSQEKERVLKDKDSAVRLRPDTKIDVFRVTRRVRDLSPWDSPYPEWNPAGYWELVLGKDAGDTPKPAPHKGQVYVKNLTKEKLEISFRNKGDKLFGNAFWTFLPGEGNTSPLGDHLVRGTDGILVTQGMILKIQAASKSERVFGATDEITWSEKDGWLVRVGDEALQSRVGPLYFKNASDHKTTIRIQWDNPPRTSPGPWDFDVGEGADETHGLSLQTKSRDISFTGTETVEIDQEIRQAFYSGSLQDKAKWDVEHNQWVLDVKSMGKP